MSPLMRLPLQQSYLSAAARTPAGLSINRTEDSTLWHQVWHLSQNASSAENFFDSLSNSGILLQRSGEAVRAGIGPAQEAAADATRASTSIHQAVDPTPLSTGTEGGALGDI